MKLGCHDIATQQSSDETCLHIYLSSEEGMSTLFQHKNVVVLFIAVSQKRNLKLIYKGRSIISQNTFKKWINYSNITRVSSSFQNWSIKKGLNFWLLDETKRLWWPVNEAWIDRRSNSRTGYKKTSQDVVENLN